MSEDPTSSRNQLRQEAASWFVSMRGPEAETRREDFEEWLRRDASHRRAYNSVSESFTLGKLLKDDTLASKALPPAAELQVGLRRRQKTQALTAVLAFGAGLAGVGLSWNAIKRNGDPTPIATAVVGSDIEARYATAVGEVRNFALPGGTTVILDTDSLILASFTPSESSLRLIKGRARFFSSTADRALVVRADTVVIRAADAVYDVALAVDTHVTVDPITGHVLVQYGTALGAGAGPSRPSSALSTIRITAGNRLELEAGKQVSTAATGIVRNNWPEGVEQFDAISLSRLIDDANRYAIRPIRLSDARLANLRISGTFRLNDTKRVAGQIAQLLDLQLNDRRDAFLLGPGCPKNAARPCPLPPRSRSLLEVASGTERQPNLNRPSSHQVLMAGLRMRDPPPLR